MVTLFGNSNHGQQPIGSYSYTDTGLAQSLISHVLNRSKFVVSDLWSQKSKYLKKMRIDKKIQFK